MSLKQSYSTVEAPTLRTAPLTLYCGQTAVGEGIMEDNGIQVSDSFA